MLVHSCCKKLLICAAFLEVLVLSGCRRDRSDNSSINEVKPRTANAADTDYSIFRFTDITQHWGVNFVYQNGYEQQHYTILESLGGGIGILDFDRDGRVDFFCPGGGTFKDKQTVGFPAELFRNIEGVRCMATGAMARTTTVQHYSHGASVADYDGDGFPDVLVTGYGGLQFWRNEGDGTFLECQNESKLDDALWSSSAGWGDFNNDGLLDLYVAHYVNWSFDNNPPCRGRTPDERDICPPREFAGLPDILYISNGDGTFSDASAHWQLRSDASSKGLGVVIADFDHNGFADIYVANDTTNNFLYSNSGKAPFNEVGAIAGVATDKIGIPNGSMGVDVIDFNRDGQLDIWVTNYEREDFALYRNEGPASFLHVSDILGLNVLGGLFVGFGTVCTDIDLDGREDILVNNGHVIMHPTVSPRAQRPVAVRAAEKRFERIEFDEGSYLMQPHEGRGLALADLDNDGDMDPIFSNLNAPLAILRDAIGAEVTLTAGDQHLLRVRKGGGSYLSTSQETLAWGLGKHQIVEQLKVRWPSGAVSSLESIQPNQLLTIVEPNNE
jgi:enediyne biosynthesis protein E4